jgi:hypothetical protein
VSEPRKMTLKSRLLLLQVLQVQQVLQMQVPAC